MAHVADHRVERIGVARHFEPDIEALDHAQFLLNIRDLFVAHVERSRDAHLPREVKPVGVDVGDHHIACARVATHRRGHDAYWSRAGDQDIFAEQVELQGGVNGIAEGIESKMAATSRSMPALCSHTFVMGRAMYSANAPGRFTPTPDVWSQRWRLPAMQLRQRSHTTCPSPETTWPGEKSADDLCQPRDQRLGSRPGASCRILGGLLPTSMSARRVLRSPRYFRTAGGCLATSSRSQSSTSASGPAQAGR